MEVTESLSDKHYVGQKLTNFSNNGEFGAISKVTLIIDDDNSISAGDNSGIEIQAECPFATQDMAEAILNELKGYRYLAYSVESADLDPAAELGDGVTASGIYSVISQIDDNGNGYPSFSAPGESELQDEYPIVGPATKELQRRINAVKQWAEEHNKALKEEIEQDMEQAGKLITGQLGGHYVVTMNPETGTPNGWALMDTDSMETATKGWRATLGGIGFFADGFNSAPNIALTMDGKINASMILTGELWANLIKAGKIQGSDENGPYFDLDKGELAADRLISLDTNIVALIGRDSISGSNRNGLALYEGTDKLFRMGKYTTSGVGITTDKDFYIEFGRGKNFLISEGGYVVFNYDRLNKYLTINRPTSSSSKNVFYAGDTDTTIEGPNTNNTKIVIKSNSIDFYVGGKKVAYIDSNGMH